VNKQKNIFILFLREWFYDFGHVCRLLIDGNMTASANNKLYVLRGRPEGCHSRIQKSRWWSFKDRNSAVRLSLHQVYIPSFYFLSDDNLCWAVGS